MNGYITSQEVRVVKEDGGMLGVLPLKDALLHAKQQDLDLVEVSPDASPPVCKLMSFSKYKYLSSKKKSVSTSSAKKMKEIKLSVGIGQRDLDIKMKRSREFILGGHAVKFALKMRGREMAHSEVGLELVKSIVAKMSDIAKLNSEVQRVGNTISTMLVPLSSAIQKAHPKKS